MYTICTRANIYKKKTLLYKLYDSITDTRHLGFDI
jgi:hypothetical protein